MNMETLIAGLYGALVATMLVLGVSRWKGGDYLWAVISFSWSFMIMRVTLRWLEQGGYDLGIVSGIGEHRWLVLFQAWWLLVLTSLTILIERAGRR